ncbi:nicotinamide riboside transporter PnuC [Flavobacteriaceae bacterium Ap0902]|nr:nicotinamide riboside transporter PnuC [Flavobacteriaceae bacterium Ap0902]
MQELLNLLTEPYESYRTWQIYLEIFATIMGISSVIFSMRRNILVFPTGIISTLIYIYLLFNWGLYGDMLINFYYSSMSIYGWFVWSRSRVDEVHVGAEYMTKKEWFYALLLFLGSAILVLTIYYFRPVLSNGFDLSKVAESGFNYIWTDYIDTCTTGIFLVGMWIMARRKVENWLFWILGDLISVPLYIVKGYAITSFQYFIFTILAIMGYMMWKKSIKSNKL